MNRSPGLGAGLPALLISYVFICGIGRSLAGEHVWPQWQGAGRDNISRESGLLEQWPDGGPKRLWTASGCGKGYSTVAVADGMIYTSGTSSQGTFVVEFDLAGSMAWRTPNGTPWQAAPRMSWARDYDGARATPTVEGGLVYHLNETGSLSVFDAKKGNRVWTVDIRDKFEAKCPDYGYTESVLIDGDRLICCPAGAKGYIAALDKKTGSLLWANTEIAEGIGFASPILIEDGGLRQVVTLTEEAVIGVAAATGKLLWRHPFTNRRKNNIPTPIYHKGYVFASTGYGAGSILIKLTIDGLNVTATTVWANTELDSMYGGIVLMDGFVYGAANQKPAWVCLDLKTGQRQYRAPAPAMGSLTYADGMLYCLGQRGTATLVPCTPERYTVAGQFEAPKGGEGLFWAQPVVCGGRLYIRHADRLYAYDIKRE